MNEPNKASGLSTLRRPANDSNTTGPIPKAPVPTPLNTTSQKPLPPVAANDEPLQVAESQLEVQQEQLNTAQDQVESTKYLMNTSDEISAKLSVLSERLKVKYEGASSATSTVPTVTTADALAERLDSIDPPQPKQQGWMPMPVPVQPKPSEDLLNKPKEEGKSSGEVKGAPDESDTPKVGAIATIGNIAKKGFDKTFGVVDKISGLLFKMSVKQIANMAMISAAIFAIILSIDLLKIAWQAWGEKILAKFEEWAEMFKGWWTDFKGWASSFSDLTTAFEGMKGDFMGIRNAWEAGDFPGLAKALGVTFKDAIMTLSGTLDRLVTKLISTVLDKLGFDTAAKAVEAEGLQRYQGKTNNKLSDENQKKVAEEQLRREKNDNLTPTQRGLTSFLPDKLRKGWALSDNEYDQIQAEKKDQASRQGMSKDEQVKVVAATNEAREAVARFKNIADNYDPNNKGQKAQFDKYKKEAQTYVNNGELSKSPTVKAELQKQIDSISKAKEKNVVAPEKSMNSKDAQTATNIKVAEAQRQNQAQQKASGTANVQNNIVKNSRNYNVQAPVTSTTAPGVFGATKVN